MNKFLHNISLLFALAVVSCSSDPDIEVIAPGVSGSPILFSAGVAPSKSSELVNSAFSAFRLYSYYSDDALYFDAMLTRNPADDSCSFDDPNASYIWPEDVNKMPMSFYGYYPNLVALNRDEAGDCYVSHTSHYEEVYQHDFVVSSLNTSDSSKPVALEFDHALSKINFTLTLNNHESNVRDVKLYYSYKQLAYSGDYYFDAKEWRGVDGTNKYSAEYSFEPYRPTSSGEKHTYDKSLYLIPQSTNKSGGYLSVRVEYALYNGDTKNHTVETSNMALVASELAPDVTEQWEMGKEYTYNLSINTSNEIAFTLTVDKREDMLAQGNIDLQHVNGYGEVTSRIATLVQDNVDDLVVAGEYSAGVLGFGSNSSPFIYGFGDAYVWTYREAQPGETATHFFDAETEEYLYAQEGDVATHVIEGGSYQYGSLDNSKLFSVDFRLMTSLPKFSVMHGSAPDNTGDPDAYIDPDAPSIPKYLFQYAERLDEVILPADVIAIGDYAFQNCKNLESINLFGAKHVEICSFQACTSLTKVITNAGEVGTLTRIHNHGFDGCTNLQEVDLSNVREIDTHGFVNCASLGEVNLSRATIIGSHAFDGCVNMYIEAGTVIPNLATISDFAFAKCATLGKMGNTDVVINNAVTIGDHAFNGCTNLFLGNDESEYELGVIESIGDYAFQYCTRIDNLDISNVTSIGNNAFYGCANINFAKDFNYANLRVIGESAFQGCANLCNVSKVTIQAEEITTLGKQAFSGCLDFDFEGVATYDFAKLTAINDDVFYECIKLDNPLKFTNTAVTSIGANSFSGCTLLPSVTINPENVTAIGEKAFYYCANMPAFEFDPTIITDIGAQAFAGCATLVINNGEELSFDKLTAVNAGVFNNCMAISNKLKFSDNLTTIGASAFAGSGITSISGLNNVNSLGEKVFEDCTQLAGALLLPSVTSLNGQWNTFRNCRSLTSIELGLTYGGTIGPGTFQECVLLNSVTGLDNITNIPFYAFNGCVNLLSLNLPEVTTIGDSATVTDDDEAAVFSNCGALKTFIASKLEKGLNALLPFGSYANLEYVELGSTGTVGGYGVKNEATGVVNGLYSNYKKLKVLKLPAATGIADGTFITSCSNYKEVYLPKVSAIGDYSMQGLSDCVLTIGTEADSDLIIGESDGHAFNNPGGIELHIHKPGGTSNYEIDGNRLKVGSTTYTFNSITQYPKL